jgi:UPF0176 protein
MIRVAAFYRFAPVADPAGLRARLWPLTDALRGTIIIAPEGVNGTVSGPLPALDALFAALGTEPGMADLTPRLSPATGPAFARMKIRLKPEIVTLGQPGVDARATGTRVAPADWNTILADPGTVVIDTRNGFEVAMGTFTGATDPGTRSFRDFPAWWAQYAPQLQDKRIAMFCTGGIRCEKASAWLQSQGAGPVLQLDGGILAYLEQVAPGDSLWQGGCFVFDERVALGHGLTPLPQDPTG